MNIKELKKARLSLKISQSALAEKLGLPQSHISKIEQGKVDIRLSTLHEMARALDSELMLIPRERIKQVSALLTPNAAKPMWTLGDDND